jgi:hypothetical protein
MQGNRSQTNDVSRFGTTTEQHFFLKKVELCSANLVSTFREGACAAVFPEPERQLSDLPLPLLLALGWKFAAGGIATSLS